MPNAVQKPRLKFEVRQLRQDIKAATSLTWSAKKISPPSWPIF